MPIDLLQGTARFGNRLRRLFRPPFTHVVPLGLSCRVTYQVRTCLGGGAAYPFDWWISPLSGVIGYLADPDPGRIYNQAALRERWVEGRLEAIESRDLGFQLFHEFPRRRDSSGRSVVAPGWEGQIAAARARHERRLARLLDLDRAGNRILFIRHKSGAESGATTPAQEIEALWSALRSRFPNARIELLLLNVRPGSPPGAGSTLPRGVERLDFDDPPGPTPEEWRGSISSWRAAFGSLGPRLRGEATRPGASIPSPPSPDEAD